MKSFTCQSIAAIRCHMVPSRSQAGQAGAKHASTAPKQQWVVLGPEKGRVPLPSQPCFDIGYGKSCSAVKNTSVTSLRLPKSWRASAEHSAAWGRNAICFSRSSLFAQKSRSAQGVSPMGLLALLGPTLAPHWQQLLLHQEPPVAPLPLPQHPSSSLPGSANVSFTHREASQQTPVVLG